jgi:iron complex outermembrane receptor protein
MDLRRPLLWVVAVLGAGAVLAAPPPQSEPAPSAADTATLVVEVRAAGQPLGGATVRAGGQEGRTDAAGHVSLSVAPGRHDVEVAAEGYRPERATVELRASIATAVEVELEPALAVREEIIVTAGRSDQRIQDVALRVEVVDREDIEEKALMTPGSVAMLLGETTGLRVQTTAPSLAAANVRIQGLRGRYSLLLSDGLPLYGVQGDSLSLLQVPPLDLGQVEIIKGAASALYGASALGGVINLVSQRPLEPTRELLWNATTQEAADLTGWVVRPRRGEWAWTLLAGLHGQKRQELDDDGWADQPAFLRGVARPRVFWDGGAGASLFATAGAMLENRRGGTIPGATAPDGAPFPHQLDTRRVDFGAVGTFPVRDRLALNVRGAFSRRTEDRLSGVERERGRRRTGFAEAVLRGVAGSHTWLLGGAVQHDAYAARDVPGFDYSYLSPGLFAQDEIRVASTASVGLSARLDRQDQYGTFASPRLSLLLRPGAGLTARLSAGTGYFAPTPFLEETEESGLARLRPLGGLVAERARSASLDAGWVQGRFELNGTLFGSRVLRPLQRREAGPERVEIVNTPGPVRTWGFEFLGRYRVESFTLLVTHAYTRATEQDPRGPGRREVPLTPRNVTSLNAIWEGEGWGRFGLEGYYTGAQPLEDDPYRTQGRSYFLFGALFEHRFGRVRAFVNLENIGNVRQTRWQPLLRPERAPDGRWTVDAWAPLDGFVANGGLRLPF